MIYMESSMPRLLQWNLIAQPIQFLANPKIAMLTSKPDQRMVWSSVVCH